MSLPHCTNQHQHVHSTVGVLLPHDLSCWPDRVVCSHSVHTDIYAMNCQVAVLLMEGDANTFAQSYILTLQLYIWKDVSLVKGILILNKIVLHVP